MLLMFTTELSVLTKKEIMFKIKYLRCKINVLFIIGLTEVSMSAFINPAFIFKNMKYGRFVYKISRFFMPQASW